MIEEPTDKAITSDSLADGGKLNPASGYESEIRPEDEENKRKVTFSRRTKAELSAFPELCEVCKEAPVSEQLSSNLWDDGWVDVCEGCADVYVPKALYVAPEGEDVNSWPAWESIFHAHKSEVPIAKAEEEERAVTGIVLEPDEVDAHNDTITAEVIKRTAENFLARYGKESELGFMHKQFGAIGLELLQSYVTSEDVVIASKAVKAGSWVMKVRVNSDEMWKRIKEGKLTGFSVGGVAAVSSPST
jgi:hypothetical protein